MAEQVECVVIGAGVIGLAVARALALRGLEVVVLEKAEAIGAETSSRNSEVVHAGIHYPKDSLKARHCVRGGEMLYDYLGEHGIPHQRWENISSPPRNPKWPNWRSSKPGPPPMG